MSKSLIWAALAAAFLIPGHALAQQSGAMCGSREQALASLQSKYSEKPVAFGLSQGSHTLTVITASSKGTWTELVIKPDGQTCVVDSGEGWQMNAVEGDGL
jgi:hypothetical protein